MVVVTKRVVAVLLTILALAFTPLIILAGPIPAAAVQSEPHRLLASSNNCWETPSAGVYVTETGHHIYEPFLSTWRQYDLAILGYPISEPLELEGMTVQYFERARFEHHPEYAGTSHEVLFTLLGNWIATENDAPAFDPVGEDVGSSEPERRYYPETGHHLQPPFVSFWDSYGGLPVFGYPISETLQEDGRLVQYFERARFEYHPEHEGTRYVVQLGHLGRLRAEADGINQSAVVQNEDTIIQGAHPEPRSYRIPTLIYHQFGTPADRYRIPYWEFERQLSWLRDNNFTSVSLTEAYAAMFEGASLPEKPVIITLDDSFESQWLAAQILDEYGFKATFFVHPNLRFTAEQLRDLVARGHDIGSHSASHASLPAVSDEQLWREVAGTREELSQILGRPVNYFAYPYGEWDARVVAAVQAAGYCGAVHAWSGTQWTPEKRWIEPRVEITGLISIADFAYYLTTY